MPALEPTVGIFARENVAIGHHGRPTLYTHEGEVLGEGGGDFKLPINTANVVGHKRVPGARGSMAEDREVVRARKGVSFRRAGGRGRGGGVAFLALLRRRLILVRGLLFMGALLFGGLLIIS